MYSFYLCNQCIAKHMWAHHSWWQRETLVRRVSLEFVWSTQPYKNFWRKLVRASTFWRNFFSLSFIRLLGFLCNLFHRWFLCFFSYVLHLFVSHLYFYQILYFYYFWFSNPVFQMIPNRYIVIYTSILNYLSLRVFVCNVWPFVLFKRL